jgi:hypothetical protein
MAIIALLNPLKRFKGALKSEVSIGKKNLLTPAPIPKVTKPLDFRIICDNIELEKKVKAACFDLFSVSEITQSRREKSKQFNLEMKTIDTNYDNLMNETPIIIDPNTEALYFKIPWKIRKKEQLYVKDAFFEFLSLPDNIIKILEKIEPGNYNKNLSKIWNEELTTSFVDSFLKYQSLYNADIIIPPVPLITGSNITLQFMRSINQKARKPISEIYGSIPSMFIPLHYKIFNRFDDRGQKIRDEIIDYIKDNIVFYKFLIIKVVWYSNIKDSKPSRKLYGEFLTKIDEIKKDMGDSFAVILLDSGPEGRFTLGNGVDCFVEPFGKKVGVYKGGKKEDDEEIEQITHGSYLHPTEGWINFDRLLFLVEKNKGVLPCSCQACENYHGQLSKNISKNKWNSSRRSHAVNLRRRQVDTFLNEIEKEKSDDLLYRVDIDEDRNFIDLLKTDNNLDNIY